MLQQSPSRSGAPTARFGERQLHSSFDPVREAERFVSRELPEVPATVVVIGPALGHALNAIRARRSDCRVLALYLNAECHRHSLAPEVPSWYPNSGTPLSDFLVSSLDELDAAGLAVIEWPPAAQCFSEVAESVRAEVSEVIRRYQASLLTEGANGRRWLSNTVRNFVASSHAVAPRLERSSGVAACVICASGPSLEESLPQIAPVRDRLALWVLGSALDAVLARGLEPDLVITTDAALYAAEYIRTATTGSTQWTIASPLTSARGIGDRAPIWVLTQDDPFEHLLFGGLSSPPTTAPAHGTVAGTATLIALALQRWPVILAGTDFASRGLQSHARPHLSYDYRNWSAMRRDPALTSAYAQSLSLVPLAQEWQTSRSLQIYAEWFARLTTRERRVARLCPPHAPQGIRSITAEQLIALPASFHRLEFRSVDWPNTGDRRERAARALVRCMDTVQEVAAGRGTLDTLQSFLLRRLAVSPLLQWRRTGNEGHLRDAGAIALEVLSTLRRVWS